MRKTVITLAAVAAVAGCSSSASTGHHTGSPSGATTSTSPAATAPPISQHPLPPDSQLVNDLKKRKAVALTKCGATEGGWGASGTATNPSPTQAADYTISIFFTTVHATVIDFATAKINVAPGSTQNWTASQKFGIPSGTQLYCVMRAVS